MSSEELEVLMLVESIYGCGKLGGGARDRSATRWYCLVSPVVPLGGGEGRGCECVRQRWDPGFGFGWSVPGYAPGFRILGLKD